MSAQDLVPAIACYYYFQCTFSFDTTQQNEKSSQVARSHQILAPQHLKFHSITLHLRYGKFHLNFAFHREKKTYPADGEEECNNFTPAFAFLPFINITQSSLIVTDHRSTTRTALCGRQSLSLPPQSTGLLHVPTTSGSVSDLSWHHNLTRDVSTNCI